MESVYLDLSNLDEPTREAYEYLLSKGVIKSPSNSIGINLNYDVFKYLILISDLNYRDVLALNVTCQKLSNYFGMGEIYRDLLRKITHLNPKDLDIPLSTREFYVVLSKYPGSVCQFNDAEDESCLADVNAWLKYYPKMLDMIHSHYPRDGLWRGSPVKWIDRSKFEESMLSKMTHDLIDNLDYATEEGIDIWFGWTLPFGYISQHFDMSGFYAEIERTQNIYMSL